MGNALSAVHPPATSTQWTTANAVAAGWGYSTVHKHLSNGLLTSARKVGREWRFDRDELESLARPTTLATDVNLDVLSDSVRDWAVRVAATAPVMSAAESRTVAAVFRRAARGGAVA